MGALPQRSYLPTTGRRGLDPPQLSLEELASALRERLTQRAQCPDAILAGRSLFYRTHGGGSCEHGYGQAELAFIGWLRRRGTLGGRGQRRSRWWAGINFDLAFYSELAAAITEHGLLEDDLPEPVRPWLTYLASPSALTWYRAHNHSIVRSALARAHDARHEPQLEQRFLGRVLVRALCVQAIHEFGDHLPVLARFTDPRSDLAERLLDLRWLYPDVYPLALNSFDGLAQTGVDALETLLWRAGLEALFRAASVWLELPAMTTLVRDGRLCYPDLIEAPAPGGVVPTSTFLRSHETRVKAERPACASSSSR